MTPWSRQTIIEKVTKVNKLFLDNEETGIEEAMALASAAQPKLKEHTLGSVTGAVAVDLSLGTIFRATATGDTVFTFTNPPAYPVEVQLWVTQDATGGHKWEVAEIEWVGVEPAFTKVAEETGVASIFVSGAQVVGWGGAEGSAAEIVGTTTAAVTALGVGAGPASLSPNTFIGVNAGHVTSTGVQNLGSGEGALAANKEGNENVGQGWLALTSLEKGTGNVAVGPRAGKTLKNASSTVAVGIGALEVCTIEGQTALGGFALHNLTTGVKNVAVGQNALFTNATGEANTALGSSALEKATKSHNTALGRSALKLLSTGESNTAVGSGAMTLATTATNCTAVGREALESVTEGTNNTAVGRGALSDVVTGEQNTASGHNALAKTTGSKNTAFGYAAGKENATGSGNVFVGAFAGEAETGSNKLYVANTNTATPLIKGDFSAGSLTLAQAGGKVGLYGVEPVAQAATFAALGETGASTVKQLEEQSNKVRAAIKGIGVIA